MHSRLPGFSRAVISLVMVAAATFYWGVPVHLMGLVKILGRSRGFKDRCTRIIVNAVDHWIRSILLIMRTWIPIRWRVRGTEGLLRNESCIVSSNHQTWADIPVLLHVFTGRIPFFRIFVKEEILWLPIIGTSLLALDYPVMKRYSRDYLKQHPEKKGRDMETTRRMCRRYRSVPVSILIFAEGTRFRWVKHARQNSPYRHLLKPRAGGLAYAVTAMEGRIRKLLDVTILYARPKPRFWDFLCGRIPEVEVQVRPIDIPEHLLSGDYAGDDAYRTGLQSWLQGIWAEKDELIDRGLIAPEISPS
ncbi:MAG: acyltransferase [Desulfobacterales bacterium]